MKARCVHRVAWFIDCPWCKSDGATWGWPPNHEIFWRAVIASDEKVRLVQNLIDNAIDRIGEAWIRREEEELARTKN